MVLKNEAKEIKLIVIKLKDGRAQTIAEGLHNVIDKFNKLGSIMMIVADTLY